MWRSRPRSSLFVAQKVPLPTMKFLRGRLTIFSRLLLGYLIILILVMAISAYNILRIGQFNEVTHSILAINNLIIEYEKRLSDIILSQIRYERNYILTKDDAFLNQFLLLDGEYNRYMGEVMSITNTSPVKNLLGNVKEDYQRYRALFDEEVRYVKDDRPYSQERYEHEKEEAENGVIEGLTKLRAFSQQDTYEKIKVLDNAGVRAKKVTALMTGAFVVFSVAISLYINRTITRPIGMMKRKTKQIAKGEFEGDLNLSSSPEIEELADALNFMCHQLRDLDKMKSDFFSSMSHELRTPLTSIKEGIGLLYEGVGGVITERQEKLLTILTEESNRLIELVNVLLDLSKMEAGMMVYHFEYESLPSLIDKTLVEVGPLAESKEINLQAKMDEALPLIKVDRERILQVLRNLVGNGLKFTPEGGRIEIAARPVERGVEVSVADTGPGIPMENLSTIFEKFQQASPAGSYRKNGTGLGLAIAKHIITSHNGKIWAESKLGQGSTFLFVLPA